MIKVVEGRESEWGDRVGWGYGVEVEGGMERWEIRRDLSRSFEIRFVCRVNDGNQSLINETRALEHVLGWLG